MDDSLQKEIDERTNLSGSNKFELLLFRLGRAHVANPANPARLADGAVTDTGLADQLYGINVFKIREIVTMPRIIKSIGTAAPLLGMINLRGQIMPVIDLPAAIGCQPEGALNILLITEYADSVQAFAVAAVEDIARFDWSQVMSAEQEGSGGMVTSIAQLAADDGSSRLVQVLDVEQILSVCLPKPAVASTLPVKSLRALLRPDAIVLAADDSKVARALIEHSMQLLDVPCRIVKTGLEAWQQLQALARQAQAEGVDVRDKVGLLLTDIEMPEMDGFTLTRNVKRDALLAGLPVLIHSSLSGSANEELIRQAGADGYVTKFSADDLLQSLSNVMQAAGRDDRAAAAVEKRRAAAVAHEQDSAVMLAGALP